jgi:hypothetical protein
MRLNHGQKIWSDQVGIWSDNGQKRLVYGQKKVGLCPNNGQKRLDYGQIMVRKGWIMDRKGWIKVIL